MQQGIARPEWSDCGAQQEGRMAQCKQLEVETELRNKPRGSIKLGIVLGHILATSSRPLLAASYQTQSRI
jgi:hypothetical protein